MKKNSLVGVSSLVFSAFLFSSTAVFSRILKFNLPVFYQSWTRSIFATIILLILILILKSWQKINKKDFIWMFLRSLAGAVGFFGSFFGFINLPIGVVLFLFYGGSLFSGYLLGLFMFKEKLTSKKIIALILAIFGLFLIYYSNFSFNNLVYEIGSLAAGFGSGTWNVLSKKIPSRYPPLQLNFLDCLINFFIVFITSLLFKERWFVPSFNILWLVNFGFSATFLITGQLMIYGFRNVSAQLGSLIMLSEVLFGIIIGAVLYKEALSLTVLAGGILVIVAMVLPEVKCLYDNHQTALNKKSNHPRRNRHQPRGKSLDFIIKKY